MGAYDDSSAQACPAMAAVLDNAAEGMASYLREAAENERLKAEREYLRARIAQEDERLGHGV